jgi:hypothetical protein
MSFRISAERERVILVAVVRDARNSRFSSLKGKSAETVESRRR